MRLGKLVFFCIIGTLSAHALAKDPLKEVSAWDVFVKQNHEVYWKAAANELEARKKFEELKAEMEAPTHPAEDENKGESDSTKSNDAEDFYVDPERHRAGFSIDELIYRAEGLSSAQNSKPVDVSFDWNPVVIAKSASGEPYVDLVKDSVVRRVFAGGEIDGWTVSIESDGRVIARKNDIKKAL